MKEINHVETFCMVTKMVALIALVRKLMNKCLNLHQIKYTLRNLTKVRICKEWRHLKMKIPQRPNDYQGRTMSKISRLTFTH